MSYLQREIRLREALQAAEVSLSDELFADLVKQLSVVLPEEIQVLARDNRGWYTASGVYEAINHHPIPSQGLAIRLGHQLRASVPICRKVGPQRFYWIAPAGVRPPEQIGVS